MKSAQNSMGNLYCQGVSQEKNLLKNFTGVGTRYGQCAWPTYENFKDVTEFQNFLAIKIPHEILNRFHMGFMGLQYFPRELWIFEISWNFALLKIRAAGSRLKKSWNYKPDIFVLRAIRGSYCSQEILDSEPNRFRNRPYCSRFNGTRLLQNSFGFGFAMVDII
jgi:hypothetical protein